MFCRLNSAGIVFFVPNHDHVMLMSTSSIPPPKERLKGQNLRLISRQTRYQFTSLAMLDFGSNIASALAPTMAARVGALRHCCSDLHPFRGPSCRHAGGGHSAPESNRFLDRQRAPVSSHRGR